jgi:eukaryotic-like serine/threonine-protein kinase
LRLTVPMPPEPHQLIKDLTPGRWRLVKEILQGAWEQDDAGRAAYVNRACADDTDLRSIVERLLASDEAAGMVPLISPTQLPGGTRRAHSEPDPDGDLLGPYRIVHEIGYGGMGTVYLAERADGQYKKRVAIKIIKPGLCNPDLLRRFTQERQLLADLDHPNIARLLDGGTTKSGLPYLVMDYVDGVRIDQWCDDRNSPVRDRLKLFQTVCSAVQYAHQKHVIHRDIKPGNIMVTSDGTPKLLDFGIAKVLDPELAGETAETTKPGAMTPDYASPEQVRGEPLGPESDIYSLGVILYRLLTGRPPYSVQRWDQMVQLVCEQEPLKPSVAARERRVSKDLDAIVLKALQKDPRKRYASAAELAEDIDRFLGGFPVEARGRRVYYRALKLVNRNLRAAVAVLVMLVASAGLWLWPNHKSPGSDQSSVAVLPFLDISPEKDQEYFADGVTEELRNMLAQVPGLRVSGRDSSNRFKRETADVVAAGKKLNVIVILEGSVRKLRNRVRLAVQLFNSADGVQLWSNTFDLDVNDVLTAQEEIARVLVREMKLTLLGKWMLSYPKTRNGEAYTAYLQGRYSFRRNREMLERAVAYFELAIRLDPRYAPAWAGLGMARVTQAESGFVPVDQGIQKATEAVARALALDPDLPDAQIAMGTIKLRFEWDWTAANALFQHASTKAPGNTIAMRLAGALAGTLGRFDEAIRLYERAIEIDPLPAPPYANLAMVLHYAGRHDEARAAVTKAIEMDPAIDGAHAILSRISLAQSHPEQALQEAQKEPNPVFRLSALALAYHALGFKQKSDSNLSALVAKFQSTAAFQIAEVYAFRHDADRAFEWLNRAFAARDSGLADLKGDPALKNLLDDPRYITFVRELRLPL